MKKYFKLLRVNHYVKNTLIFLPLIFSGSLLNIKLLITTCIAFVSFSLITSVVYIFNDLCDVEKDRKHPTKKLRPIASGQISMKRAKIILCILLIISMIIQILLSICGLLDIKQNIISILMMLSYVILNILYSKGLKNVPIIDIAILTFGFVIRVLYGGQITGIEVSNWLYLTILSLSIFFVIGKRRGELRIVKESKREVLKYYNDNFLTNNMYVFLAVTLVFYSLWCILKNDNQLLIWSICLVIMIMLKYSLIIEKESLADPIDVLQSDTTLKILSLVYVLYMGVVMYV